MRRRLYMLLTCFVVSLGLAFAQSRHISGSVVDEKGVPVIGASVVVKGTSVGTATDADGKFDLRVPQGKDVLTVSYLGMISQDVQARNAVKVVLKNNEQALGEVVVTALGISKEKRSLGYAVQSVNSDELTQAASNSLSSALQGKLTGVDIAPSSGMPGASAKITIRGSRSFTGDNTPLYVVDGMPISSTADMSTGTYTSGVTGTDWSTRAVDIDPNDIESINVLEGQAASALYGMRASNGVIVITTKSGRGARKSKPEISFTSNLSFDKISTKPDIQTEYAQGTGGVYSPTSSTSYGPKISDLPNDSKYGGNVANTYTNNGSDLHKGQYYVPQRAAAGLDPWAYPGVYDNVGKFFQTAATWNNSVNVAQSLDKGNYSFSIGNLTNKGIVPSTGMDRYSARLSAEVFLNDHFKTGFSGNFVTSTITKQSGANNGIVATVYPAPPSYDLAGIPSNIAGDPYTQNAYRSTTNFDDAYWAVKNNRFSEKNQRFFGNVYVSYETKFSENQKLNVKYQLGDDAYTTNYLDLWGYGSASNKKGAIDDYHWTVSELNSLLTATYDWKITPAFDANLLVGNEFVQNQRKYNDAYGSNFSFSGWNSINNATIYSASSTNRERRTVGNFANLSLSYKDMLYLNGTVRTDIVSSMPRNHRTFTYPSASLGFVFTQLNELKNNILTYGKLRASYAEVGMAGNYYQTYYTVPTYGSGWSAGIPILYPIGGVNAYTPYSVVYDPNLKPQNTKSYELGTDLTFFNGLVSLNYTFSRQNTKDQIFAIPLAGSTGSSQIVTNGGSLHTVTHEITLGLNPVNTKDFKWNFAFNFTKIRNVVDQLAPGVESIFLGGFVTPQVRVASGYTYPVIYGVGYLRNSAGQIIVDQNGLPQAGPAKVLGSVSPNFRLGFNTNIELFKFNIAAVFDWKNGGNMYCGTLGMLDYYGVSKYSAALRDKGNGYIIADGVKQQVDANGNTVYVKNDIKATVQNYFSALSGIDEYSVRENSFIKLRELSLSYPVYSKSWLNVRLNLFARNLILWSTLKGFDPEASQGNDNMTGAFERFSLPGTSTYGFGVNVKF